MIRILTPARFSCTRTCTPGHLCQFQTILNAIGRTQVVSHTVTVKIELRDKSAIAAAVAAMGGQILGEGTHQLFNHQSATGYGFTLPGWMFPLVLTSTGELKYDDYNGHWGNVRDLDTLKGRYAIEAARAAADSQGWTSYDQEDGSLEVHHPSGGKMTVYSDGTVDNVGFIGSACNVAQVLEQAIGTPGDRQDKPEAFGTTSIFY